MRRPPQGDGIGLPFFFGPMPLFCYIMLHHLAHVTGNQSQAQKLLVTHGSSLSKNEEGGSCKADWGTIWAWAIGKAAVDAQGDRSVSTFASCYY